MTDYLISTLSFPDLEEFYLISSCSFSLLKYRILQCWTELSEGTNILDKSHFSGMKRGNLDFSTDQSGSIWCSDVTVSIIILYFENNRIYIKQVSFIPVHLVEKPSKSSI